MPLKALRNRFRGPEYDCNAKTLGYAWSISTYRRTVPQNRRARRAGDSDDAEFSGDASRKCFTPRFTRAKLGGRNFAADPAVSETFGDISTTAPV
jgi:hypothetical protein